MGAPLVPPLPAPGMAPPPLQQVYQDHPYRSLRQDSFRASSQFRHFRIHWREFLIPHIKPIKQLVLPYPLILPYRKNLLRR